MEQLIPIFFKTIELWGYTALAVSMALNSILPIPGELILLFAGCLIGSGKLLFSMTVFSCLCGCLLGAMLTYGIGKYGGHAFLLKYGSYFALKPSRLLYAERCFHKYGALAIIISRMLPILRTLISLPAGISQISLLKFISCTIIGTLPWLTTILYLGANLEQAAAFPLFDFSCILLFILLLSFIAYTRYRHQQAFKNI